MELLLIKVLVKIILFNLGLLAVINHTSKSGFIKDGLHESMYTLCHRSKAAGHRSKRTHSQIHAVLVRNLSIHIHIAILNQIELNIACSLFINGCRLAVHLDELALEVIAGSSGRTVVQNLLDVGLQIRNEALITFTCDNRQLVDVVDALAENLHIHSVTGLVDTKTETTTNFLPLLCGAVAVLQCTNLEHIGVIPAFTQSRVREDKSCWLAKGKQALLVLQDKVISGNIIRELRAALQGRVNAASGLLVNTEIALVGISNFNITQILLIRCVKYCQIFVENSGVFFLENPPVFAELLVAVLIILAVLGHLVNEEQRQGFDAHFKQFFFLLKVRLNGLSDLDTTHILLNNITDNLALVDNSAACECHSAAKRLYVGDNIAVLVLLHFV